MQILFSKEIIAAIIAGIISLISVLLTTRNNSKTHSILKERIHWRNELRDIAKKLSRFTSKGGKQTELDELLTMLKVRINPYGQFWKSNAFSKDEHIWECIKHLEKGDGFQNKTEQRKLIDYIALLLKYDCDKSDREFSLNYLELLGFCVYIVSNILFVYFAYADFTGTSVFLVVTLLLMFSSFIALPLFTTVSIEIFRIPKVWSDIVPYGIVILAFILLLHQNKVSGNILNTLVLPIILQMISAILLALSNLQEIVDNYRYGKAITDISEKYKKQKLTSMPHKTEDKPCAQNTNEKATYLQMIQEPICRMSTISAIFKGFAATIVAGIAIINYKDTHLWILVLSFLPVITFAIMDIYYLYLEKRFRELYKDVCDDNHPVDFSLDFKKYKSISKGKIICSCLKSPSFYLFYPALIMILIIVYILKYTSVI